MTNIQAQKKEPGVSYELAQYRKSTISEIKYDLYLSIPESKTENIDGKETLTFLYKKQNDSALLIDFKEDTKSLKTLTVNKQRVQPTIENEHISIDGKLLNNGTNKIECNFIAGNAALNRRDGYLYTLFVPDRARTMFPCFDQPNLKARFELSLTIPKKWNAIANGKLKDSIILNNKKTYRFAVSDILPTYLFSFATGDFRDYTVNKNRILYRETDTTKISNSMDSIFTIYANALKYYEQWTGIPYPFQKYGMVAIPDFQFGGMEHPGAILFQNASLFLDNSATQNQLNTRSNLIAHEVAHMWFGDMVTMDWFNDVWTKEVFANFMSDKSTGASTNKEVYDLKFLTSHFPLAYSVDRTLGANPIRQKLDNLQNAGMMYGSIIYDKAPIMMRQLELLMGEENFQKGIRQYLKQYAYKNATWPDLIAILNNYTTEDLQSWNNIWVNEPNRPVINYTTDYANNTIEKFIVSQHPEYGTEEKIWKQTFDISLYYPDSILTIPVHLNNSQQEIPELKNKKQPLFIQLNSDGIGYGAFQTDTVALHHFNLIKNPVRRASAYISLYENMLNHTTINPTQLLHFLSSQLQSETNELNLRLISNYIATTYWEFLSKGNRSKESTLLEKTIWYAMQKQTPKNNKKVLFDCYQNIFQSQLAYSVLYGTWKKQSPPIGVTLNDEDYTGLALSLALRNNDNQALLQAQLSRIKNPDRAARFKIIMQGASSDIETRNAFFNNLSQKHNRSNESAVGAALSYLHHPLRQETSIRYLPQTLELLQTIQKTGDIFFPDNWLRASFSYYQNAKAFEVVKAFIEQHTDYNAVLKNKILQATDNLRRAQELVQ
ncbi:MAG: M1 family aminopeptidase [Chitinophagaceae bacterium]